MDKIKVALRQTNKGYNIVLHLEEKDTYHGKRRYSKDINNYYKRLPVAMQKLKEFVSRAYVADSTEFVGIIAEGLYTGEEVK